jgi:hypothetical protein
MYVEDAKAEKAGSEMGVKGSKFVASPPQVRLTLHLCHRIICRHYQPLANAQYGSRYCEFPQTEVFVKTPLII